MKRKTGMKLKRVKVPAHRDYFLTLVLPNGKRVEWYLPYVFRSAEAAQAEADARNKHYKHGALVVDFRDYPESWAYEGSLKL